MYSKFKKGKRGRKKKFNRRRTPSHYLKVLCTSNNTHACLTDKTHSIISASSGGNAGFKGAKKSTAYTAQVVIEKVLSNIKDHNIRFISIFIKGIGKGRFSVAKTAKSMGFVICTIRDNTPVCHNGCRPPKKRRI